MKGIETWNSIFWQPKFSCGKRLCAKDCYVAQSAFAWSDKDVWKYLIDRLYYKKDLDCSHLTISVDRGMIHSGWFEKIWPQFLFHRSCGDYRHLFHFTCSSQDIHLFPVWQRAINPMEKSSLAKTENDFTSLISISLERLESLQLGQPQRTYLQEKRFRLGVNYVVRDDFFADDIVTALEESTVSQIYLILEKHLDFERQRESLRTYIGLLNQLAGDALRRRLSGDQRIQLRRIVIDRCVKDMFKRKQVCSAGIDKFHIWPNGFITACPYDSFGIHHMKSLYETNHFRDYAVDFCNSCLVKRGISTLNGEQRAHTERLIEFFG
jgi:hypothetical protein